MARNDLNSIIIEGSVSGKYRLVEENGIARCSFVLSSKRYYMLGMGAIEEQETRVRIMVRNPNKKKGLADVVMEQARDGRRLRIVGRIAADLDGGIYIEAEHIKFCPEYAKKAASDDDDNV